jgi:ribonucleoside-diphosphate reductase alpha chain
MNSHITAAITKLSNNYPKIDWQELEKSIRITIRNLDNVIDVNFYSTPEAKNSNQSHRPIGLGVMGWQDMLQQLGINMESQTAVDLSDKLFEFISYISIDESCELAAEKGKYPTYDGSTWSEGLLPIDLLENYSKERGGEANNNFSKSLDWETLKAKIQKNGIRNSQLMAIAPTRSISYIAGTSPSIEPWDSNIFTEVGMTGKYQLINENLVEELSAIGLWNNRIIEEIKNSEGSIQEISEIPENIRLKYKTAWEIHPKWLIAQNAARQKWVDMSISFNMWLPNNNGKDAERLYKEAWKSMSKTTYYLHTKSKSQAERTGKITDPLEAPINTNIPISDFDLSSSEDDLAKNASKQTVVVGAACDMTDPNCEACQ